ncbi:hypothetical protein WDU94_003056 [Cyamophila willieti]
MSPMDRYLIYYYLQSEQYGSVLAVTEKNSHQPEYTLYGALVYIRVGHYVEALRQLNIIQHVMGDCKLATLLLLIVAHKKCMDPDFGTISELELSLKQAQPCSNEKSLALAALGLYFTRHVDKAVGFAEKVLKLNSTNVEARLVLAWTELSKKQTKNAHSAFKAIATLEPKCIPALIGDVLTSTDRADQLSKLNRILVQYPTVDAPLIEKLSVCLSGKDWVQCYELSERLATLNENSSVANKISQQLDLLTEISAKSPSPHIILVQISQLSSQTEIRTRLDGIVKSQMSLVARQPFGYQYLIDLNVDILLTVLAEYLTLVRYNSPIFLA